MLATANQQHIDSLVSSGLVKKSLVFARNELVLVVPGDNPAAIESFVDLPRSSRFVIGSKQVPVGSYTDQMLTRSGQHLGLDFEQRCRSRVVSRENNVRLVRAKVELGEADAAIIYRTDTTSFDRVRSIAIPEQINVKAEYFLGELSATRHQKLAGEWITFVLSAEGQKILAQHGFVEG